MHERRDERRVKNTFNENGTSVEVRERDGIVKRGKRYERKVLNVVKTVAGYG